MNSTLDERTIARPEPTAPDPRPAASPPAADVTAAPARLLVADAGPTSAALRPAADAAADVDPAGSDQDDPEFRGFSKAVLMGIVLGIPILAAVVAGGVWLAAPDTDPWAIVGIAAWVSLFCGPFLAGTVTVGLWSGANH